MTDQEKPTQPAAPVATPPAPVAPAAVPTVAGSYAERRGATLAAMKEANRPGSSKPIVR